MVPNQKKGMHIFLIKNGYFFQNYPITFLKIIPFTEVVQEARVKTVGRDRVPNPKIARDLTDLVQDLVIVRKIDTTSPDLDPGIGKAG